MSAITTTTFSLPTTEADAGLSLRCIPRDGEPWFIAADLSAALGFKDAHSAVQHLDADERANLPLEGFSRGAIAVNESGLYSLILRSRKPQAKAFRKWVTATVLPTLRKEGLYIAGQEKPVSADMELPELLAHLADIQAKVNAIAEAKLAAYALHRERRLEESAARRTATRLLARKTTARRST